MKIKTKTDTGMVYKKVKLIDNLTIGSSYDAALDSFNLRNITMNGRTTLFKVISLNGGMTFNPYARNSEKRLINKYQFQAKGKLARFTSGNLAMSFALSPETFSKKKTEQEEEGAKEIDPSEFHKISWNASFNYNFRATKTISSTTDNDTTLFIQTAGVSGTVNFTKNWRIGFNVNYDISNKEISYTSLDIYRDLHCWEMKLGWIPFGPRQSYNFQINVKSSILQDLRYKKQSQPNEFR